MATNGNGNGHSPPPTFRLLNRDGTFNVITPKRKLHAGDLYHSLLTLRWRTFYLLLAASWMTLNLLFALGYFACGESALSGSSGAFGDSQAALGRFGDCFFFSVHTLATIGYGNLTPHGLGANLLVMVEAFLGLLGLAIATGLLFNRFSRPSARVIFSNRAIIADHDGTPSLIFRLANARMNQIVEATVRVVLSRDEFTAEGDRYRNFTDLKLERERSPIFMMSWTIVHAITPDSPLYGMDHAALVRTEAELIVTMNGTDDTFAQPIHSRYSYAPEDILWNRDFVDILMRGEDGKVAVYLERIHDILELEAKA
jgi:inward rectifier potassium channel